MCTNELSVNISKQNNSQTNIGAEIDNNIDIDDEDENGVEGEENVVDNNDEHVGEVEDNVEDDDNEDGVEGVDNVKDNNNEHDGEVEDNVEDDDNVNEDNVEDDDDVDYSYEYQSTEEFLEVMSRFIIQSHSVTHDKC